MICGIDDLFDLCTFSLSPQTGYDALQTGRKKENN